MQDRKGRGPWKPGFSECWVEDRTEEEFQLIAPPSLQTMLQLRHRANGYGCETKDQLKLWFKVGEYNKLVRLGYRAVSIDVDSILWRGDNQSAFFRAKPLKQGAKLFNLYNS